MADLPSVAQRYDRALREFVASRKEAALQTAYELGREAIAAGWGVLDLLRVHEDAVAPLLNEYASRGGDGAGGARPSHTSASVAQVGPARSNGRTGNGHPPGRWASFIVVSSPECRSPAGRRSLPRPWAPSTCSPGHANSMKKALRLSQTPGLQR